MDINYQAESIKEEAFASIDHPFDVASSCVNRLVSDYALPEPRKLEFYDDGGCLFIKETNLDVRAPGIYNPLLINTIRAFWVSSPEKQQLFDAAPELLQQIQSRIQLKPTRVPHIFDGVIHWVEILFSRDNEPVIRICYTSAVFLNGLKKSGIILEGEDWIDPEYLCLFSYVSFPLSNAGILGDYRL